MDYYLISLPRSARVSHSVAELTQEVEALPGNVKIIDGRGKDVLTVAMDSLALQQAAESIPFARIENYHELELLH